MSTPVVLLLGGHDPSGGAGVVADALVAGARGVHPVTIVTALTEQDTARCDKVHPVAAEIFAATLARTIDDVGDRISAIKIGMLGSVANANAVRAALAKLTAPSVLDPIFRPTHGVPLIDDGGSAATEALLALCELVTLVTPNAPELAQLTALPVTDEASLLAAAEALAKKGSAVLAKGGHLPASTANEAIDLLVHTSVTRFAAPRVMGTIPHGTGCALSTAIAVQLAHHCTLEAAVAHAITEVRARISAPMAIGQGRPLLRPSAL